MLKHFLFLPAAVLLLLAGCETPGCGPTPEPTCLEGTVVSRTCVDGVLIQVDGPTQIGSAWQTYSNVIATHTQLPGLDTRGQKVYFTYRPEAPADRQPSVCQMAPTIGSAFRYVLTDVSGTGCGQTR